MTIKFKFPGKFLSKKELSVVILLLIFASFPRCIELISGNYIFGYDQGVFLEAVRSMVELQRPSLIGTEVGGAGGFFQGPGWYYLIAIPLIIGNWNPIYILWMMFACGIVSILVIYIFLRSKFNFHTAILGALFMALSPELITHSRFFWPPFVIPLLSIFYFIFIKNIFESKKYALPLALFVTMLMANFEITTSAIVLAVTILWVPVFLYKKFVSFRDLLLSLVASVIPISPLILFDFRHDHIITRGILKLFVGGRENHSVTLYYAREMFLNHVDKFTHNFLTTFQYSQVLYPAIILISIIGILLYLRDKKIHFDNKLFLIFLLIFPFISFLILMLYLWPMWSWWILHLSVVYILIVTIAFGYLWNGKLKILITVILFLSIIFFVNATVGYYKNDLRDYGGHHKIQGKKDAVEAIFQDAKGAPFGIVVYMSTHKTHPYDYVIWLTGRKYGYQPGREMTGTYYVLMEPDLSSPWLHKGWVETSVPKEDKIIFEQTLKSDIVIQKRISSQKE